MDRFHWRSILCLGKELIRSFLGSVTFYTIIPMPAHWNLEFQRIARWIPLIGLLIGAFLGWFDDCLYWLKMPILTRSALVIGVWIGITGGLHLDGAIDTADGLATIDRQKRLEVMKDSVTGAFGVMAAVMLLFLKIAALSDLSDRRYFALIGAAAWGRWGQVVAIALYPYLRETGKGSFHKGNIRPVLDITSGLFLLSGLSGLELFLTPDRWWIPLISFVVGATIALGTGFWFNYQLGGHTGDTYGAVVEVRFVG